MEIIKPKTPLEAFEHLETFLFLALNNYNRDGKKAMIGMTKQELFNHLYITKNQIKELSHNSQITNSQQTKPDRVKSDNGRSIGSITEEIGQEGQTADNHSQKELNDKSIEKKESCLNPKVFNAPNDFKDSPSDVSNNTKKVNEISNDDKCKYCGVIRDEHFYEEGNKFWCDYNDLYNCNEFTPKTQLTNSEDEE